VLPVARLRAEARRLGILSIVDGAHAPGQIPLDADATGADVYRGPPEVQRRLWERNRIEVPVERIGGLTVVRVSVQGYVSDDDCRALVDALAALLL